MKKINILLASLFIASFTIGCDKDGEEHPIFENRVIAGVAITIDGEGAIQGVPANPDDLANSTVDFSVNTLEMHVEKASVEDESLISSYEVVKQFNGGEEITVASYESLPFDVNLTELNQF